jgi:hypothetical protein
MPRTSEEVVRSLTLAVLCAAEDDEDALDGST